MNPHQQTVLLRGYVGISILGWLFFGVLLRAALDSAAAGRDPVPAMALTSLFGMILLVGTPVGYRIIRGPTRRRR